MDISSLSSLIYMCLTLSVSPCVSTSHAANRGSYSATSSSYLWWSFLIYSNIKRLLPAFAFLFYVSSPVHEEILYDLLLRQILQRTVLVCGCGCVGADQLDCSLCCMHFNDLDIKSHYYTFHERWTIKTFSFCRVKKCIGKKNGCNFNLIKWFLIANQGK